MIKALARTVPVGQIDPGLIVALGVGGVLRLSRLGDFDNDYYTATVASMLQSVHNFAFGSFDPAGVVMVDKPPASFWLQAVPASIFGANAWSVTLPQIIMGIAAIAILYLLIRPVYGRAAAVGGALVLGVLPASVVIDSRNEPDALVSFALLIAAFSIVRAVRTGRYRWYLLFGALVGLAFNAKMFVAFVPLPAFLVYSVVAANRPTRETLLRTSSAIIVLVAVSASWVTLVAMTPAENRPYIGSTRDDSIRTLVLEYNGLDRFTSFIGAGPRPVAQAQPLDAARGPAGPSPPYPAVPPQARQPGTSPPGQLVIVPATPEAGILALLGNPLAGQLGWLLPVGIVALLVVLVSAIPDEVYRRPASLLTRLRTEPTASHAVLWTGWMATGLMVFGSANATTTHPYYLVGVGVPLAAVIGIGSSALWRAFRAGGLISWTIVGALAAGVGYQICGARGEVGEWSFGLVIGAVLFSAVVLLVGLRRGLQASPLARIAFITGAASLLLIPAAASVAAGGRIAGPPGGINAAGRGSDREPGADREARLIRFLEEEEARVGATTLFAVNARDAAPFIIGGVRAIAIGGFSGNDPVLTVESFREAATNGPHYFLMPLSRQDPQGASPDQGRQQAIIDYVLRSWHDVSYQAELPRGSVYGKPAV